MKANTQKIFISYRREDTQDIVGRIRDWLVRSGQHTFMDVYDAQIGANFLQQVGEAIKQCTIMLVVIGSDWFVDDKTPSSYVHDEVRLALRYRLKIVPILVHGATMPTVDKLPDDIRDLAFFGACEIRNDNFENAMKRVAIAIGIWRPRQFKPALLSAALLLILVLVVSLALEPVGKLFHPTTSPSTATKTVWSSPSHPEIAGIDETAGANANTWTDYTSAGGNEGQTVPAHQSVKIACKVTGFKVKDGNTWWYRIASPPWDNKFYASADAFYNNGAKEGSLLNTPHVDSNVPDC